MRVLILSQVHSQFITYSYYVLAKLKEEQILSFPSSFYLKLSLVLACSFLLNSLQYSLFSLASMLCVSSIKLIKLRIIDMLILST